MGARQGGDRTFVIAGGGAAGLSAALELQRLGQRVRVLESTPAVGGLARTETHEGFRFDMGGHRFFTKVPEVAALWKELLGDDFLKRPRLSRIYYRGRFLQYPLRVADTLRQVGVWEAAAILSSYALSHVMPRRPEVTFEDWVTNRFGARLFRAFFKSYTEKVWGVPCSELRADWAAQRIRDLSVKTLVVQTLTGRGNVTSLIEEFHYPRLGPGMMWERAANRIREQDGAVELNTHVERFVHRDGKILSAIARTPSGPRTFSGTDFISSMPLPALIRAFDPAPPEDVVAAAAALRHRAFLTVCVVVRKAHLFPDNWIYVHEESVRVARIQNFKNWSADMCPDAGATTLGLEYFCNEGDEVWNLGDAELVEIARTELEVIGLAAAKDVESGCVFRMPCAYPLYDESYARHLGTVRGWLASIENLETIGRNGLHRYNNQDHSMLTGLIAARNAVLGRQDDVWSVNTDAEYHETARATGGG